MADDPISFVPKGSHLEHATEIEVRAPGQKPETMLVTNEELQKLEKKHGGIENVTPGTDGKLGDPAIPLKDGTVIVEHVAEAVERYKFVPDKPEPSVAQGQPKPHAKHAAPHGDVKNDAPPAELGKAAPKGNDIGGELRSGPATAEGRGRLESGPKVAGGEKPHIETLPYIENGQKPKISAGPAIVDGKKPHLEPLVAGKGQDTASPQTLKDEIQIAMDMAKLEGAQGAAERAAALKALNHDVAHDRNAAREVFQGADTTKMNMEQIDAIVAVRDALRSAGASQMAHVEHNGAPGAMMASGAKTTAKNESRSGPAGG